MKKESVKRQAYSPTLDKMAARSKPEGVRISWAGADATLLWELVVAVNDANGAVMFGGTRDRGAWAVHIKHDQLPKGATTEYCSSEEFLNDFLQGLVTMWQVVAIEIASEGANNGD